jgi:hypothetical protein
VHAGNPDGTTMNDDPTMLSELASIDAAAIGELTRRVQDIHDSYRVVAQKMGQLYMSADELKVSSLTRGLDKPMRNASDNERIIAAMLDELQAFSRSCAQ